MRHEARAASPMERARRTPSRAERVRPPRRETRPPRDRWARGQPDRFQPRDFLVAAYEDACARLSALCSTHDARTAPRCMPGDATASRSIGHVSRSITQGFLKGVALGMVTYQVDNYICDFYRKFRAISVTYPSRCQMYFLKGVVLQIVT